MVGIPLSFYAEARLRAGTIPVLREDEPAPPERLLQAIWYHQRIHREQLRTIDGRSLQVLHPGFWNREAGPDFRKALLQFEDGKLVEGDVEVDVRSSGWRDHGHDRNSAFAGVQLHVVWHPDRPSPLPTLHLPSVLDASVRDLGIWLGSDAATEFPFVLMGQCSAPLSALSPADLTEMLRQAALVRLQAKASRFQARARKVGWEQSLWEGLFRALGYKHNVWPMQRLGELRARLCAADHESPAALTLQARLLGVSNLLPAEMSKARADHAAYWRRIWDCWWRDRGAFDDCQIPQQLWRFHGLRPANHPQRRIALASHWLASKSLTAGLERWGVAELRPSACARQLYEVMQVTHDDFWSWHWTLHSPRLAKPQPLLGATRITDVAMNVVLPWLWMRATEGRNEPLQRSLENRYLGWPRAQDNAALRLARARLLGSEDRPLPTAAAQQGLLQIVRDFCEHSNSLCAHCRFPELIQEWRTGG